MNLLIWAYTAVVIGGVIIAIKNSVTKDNFMSVENLSKGIMRVGIQGSGKTFAAINDVKELLERGHRFCWITTQGERQCRLIDYIPSEYKKDIELFAPYKPNSKGFNWLKCYENNDNERQLRAQSTVFLIKNLFDHMTSNIEYGIYTATLAILEYGYKMKQRVTLYDVWKFIDSELFRIDILSAIKNEDLELGFEKIRKETLESISRKMGYLLTNKNFLNAMCYTKDDELDFQEMFDKIFICDFIEDNIRGLGTMQAITLAKAVMIQFNILASTRNTSSNFYQVVCDEFYRYADGIEDIFRDFPDIHRQRRIGLYLIWQRMSQMNNELLAIALSCVNKYFMMISPEDDSKMSSMEMYKPYRGRFSNLEPRQFISFLNVDNKLEVTEGTTEDVGVPNEYTYTYVVNNCKSKFKETKFEWWYRRDYGFNSYSVARFDGSMDSVGLDSFENVARVAKFPKVVDLAEAEDKRKFKVVRDGGGDDGIEKISKKEEKSRFMREGDIF